jgi:hypothetical protein
MLRRQRLTFAVDLTSGEGQDDDSILKEAIQSDGSLACGVPWIEWTQGHDIKLDGYFSADDLRAIADHMDQQTILAEAYAAGRDCALNGANTTNSHFRHFATPEQTKAWEKGKAEAEANQS